MRRPRLAVHPPSLKHQSVGDGAGPAAWLIVAIAKPITFSLERRPRPNHTSRGEHTTKGAKSESNRKYRWKFHTSHLVVSDLVGPTGGDPRCSNPRMAGSVDLGDVGSVRRLPGGIGRCDGGVGVQFSAPAASRFLSVISGVASVVLG